MSTQISERNNQHAEIQQMDGENTRNRPVFVPRTDIYETKDSIVVIADMPGCDEQSVDITLEKNRLTINGLVEPRFEEGYSLTYNEYSVGDYRRVFTLSDEVDRDNISASVKNGVLKLVLPKSQKAQAKKISVRGE
jgi:HSP20 family protein